VPGSVAAPGTPGHLDEVRYGQTPRSRESGVTHDDVGRRQVDAQRKRRRRNHTPALPVRENPPNMFAQRFRHPRVVRERRARLGESLSQLLRQSFRRASLVNED
jgi:hypothetical protein